MVSPKENPLPAFEPMQRTARTPIHTLTAAKRAVFEASNRVLLGALTAMCVALLAITAWTYGIYLASLERAPLYFGITEENKIMQLRPEALNVQVTDEILRNQLEGFVERHYSRLPNISTRDYKASLLMMDAGLTTIGNTTREDEKQIEELNLSPTAKEQVEIAVTNSTYEGTSRGCDPKSQPCAATVYLTRTVRQGGQVTRQSASIVQATFVILKKIKLTPDMVRYNPLGIVITSLHETEGHSR